MLGVGEAQVENTAVEADPNRIESDAGQFARTALHTRII
jgi:hypothetical protein